VLDARERNTEAQSFPQQLAAAEVTPWRCSCGCASINIQIKGTHQAPGGLRAQSTSVVLHWCQWNATSLAAGIGSACHGKRMMRRSKDIRGETRGLKPGS
jgi:hypothetical protein